MAMPLAASGRVAPGEFAPLLRMWMSRLVVGRLELAGEGWVRNLWLDAGHVRAIVSDREDEKIGNWLVKQGRLGELPMAMSLLQQPQGMRFGTFVVQQGLLSVETLEAELQALAVVIVSRLLFASGAYSFVEGERVASDAATLNMTTATLLMNAVRALETLARLEPLLRSSVYVWGAQDAFTVYQKAMLTPDETEVLKHVTGEATIQKLFRQVTLSQDEFLRALGALMFAGFAVLRDNPAQTLAPAPKVAPPPAAPATEEIQFSPRQERERTLVIKMAARIRHQNQYDRLQLNAGATQGQVYMRYREFAEVFHPDRANEPHLRGLQRELAEIFKCVTEAYEELGHEDTRRKHDTREHMGWRSSSYSSGSGIPRDDEDSEAPRPQVPDSQTTDRLKRVRELIAAGQTAGAIELLEQAVRVSPEPAALLLLARLEAKNPITVQRALDHLRYAVSIDTRFTDGWLELAALWKARNDTARQRECLMRVLSYDAGNRQALEAFRSLK